MRVYRVDSREGKIIPEDFDYETPMFYCRKGGRTRKDNFFTSFDQAQAHLVDLKLNGMLVHLSRLTTAYEAFTRARKYPRPLDQVKR